MDIEKIISLPKHHKKTFIALLIVTFVVTLLISHFVGGQQLKDLILDQVKSIASALITALLGLLIIVPFIPTPEKGESSEIQPSKITKEFEILLSTATRWRYKGNFGRYLRGKVLPTLADRKNIHIIACLIDPRNKKLCESHAEYRAGINAIDKGTKYDADIVAIQVVVTIILSSWYVANKKMQIDLYLSSSYDPVRIDSNDEAMILTVEDRRSPALKITKNHFTYEHYDLQMQTSREQSEKVNIGGMRKDINISEITVADVEKVMETAAMTDLCKSLGAAKILAACQKSKNPYEN